jgi:Fic family protein
VAVQQWIDGGALAGRAPMAEAICEIHRRFCALLPPEMLWVTDSETGERARVEPGELRRRDVKVGRHVPISPGAVPRFLDHLERAYRGLGRADAIVAAAAAHHRLLWIHPFLYGNGRVARLMTHAMLLDALDTGGIWSAARGLARNQALYKEHLARCDLPRRNDLDVRGALSEEELAGYTRFFLELCIDQVAFMEGLVQPDRLRARILVWAEEEARLGGLPARAGNVIEAILYRGDLPRGEVPTLLSVTDRQARRVVAALGEHGVVVSASTRAPLRLAFPATLAPRWMPGLFPERTT